MKRILLILALILPFSANAFATFTFVGSAGTDVALTTGATPVPTITVALAGVHAGDLVVVGTSHEGTGTTITALSGATSLTQAPCGTIDNPGSSGEPHATLFYVLSSLESGTVTYTAQFSGSRPWSSIAVIAWTPSASAALDGNASGSSGSTGTTATSGNYSTTAGTIDGLSVAYYAEYGSALTSPKVNSVAADHIQCSGTCSGGSAGTGGGRYEEWSLAYTTGFATAAATGTLSTNRWTVPAAAFIIGGAAASTRHDLTLVGVGK